MRPPRFITPVAWIIAVLAAIGQITSMYHADDWFPIAAGMFGIMMIVWFTRLLRRARNDGAGPRYVRLRTTLKVGIISASLLLVTPGVLAVFNQWIYPRWIEPRVMLGKLEGYLRTGGAIAPGWIPTERSEHLAILTKAHRAVVRDESVTGAQELLDKVRDVHWEKPEFTAFAYLVQGQHANLKGASSTAITALNEALLHCADRGSFACKTIKARASNSKALALSRSGQQSAALDLYRQAAAMYRELGSMDYADQVIGTSLVAIRRSAHVTGPQGWIAWENAYTEALTQAQQNGKGRAIILSNGIVGYTDVRDQERDAGTAILENTETKLQKAIHEMEILNAEGSVDLATRTHNWINIILGEGEAGLLSSESNLRGEREVILEEIRTSDQLGKPHYAAAFEICDGYITAAQGDFTRAKQLLKAAWKKAREIGADDLQIQSLKALRNVSSDPEKAEYELRLHILKNAQREWIEDIQKEATRMQPVLSRILPP